MSEFCEICHADLSCWSCNRMKTKLQWPDGHHTYECDLCDPGVFEQCNNLWIHQAIMDRAWEARFNGGFL